MKRRATPAQKEAPWGLVELLTAAAKVGEGIAWLEVEAGTVVDVGILVIAKFPDDVDEMEPSRDDDDCVPSGAEVAYANCKHVSAYNMITVLTEVEVENNGPEGRADAGSAEVAIC